MKSIKVILFALVTLSVLLFGSSIGASAIINNTGSRTEVIQPSALNDAKDFSVDIYFVGTGSTTGQEIQKSADGTYLVITESVQDFEVVRIKTNISGFTCWGASCATSPGIEAGPDKLITMGQPFLIVDGFVQHLGSSLVGDSGFDVTLSAGAHTVTVLYVGKDEAAGTQWASDTVIVRVGTSTENLGTYKSLDVPLTYSVTDVATAGKFMNMSVNTLENTVFFGLEWKKQTLYDVGSDVNVTYDDASVTVDDAAYSFAMSKSGTAITLSGTVNSTGFDGNQTSGGRLGGGWNSTVGTNFIVDANGVRLADGTITSVALHDNDVGTMLPEAVSTTFVGVLTLADYGRWTPISPSTFVDFEGLSGFTNTTWNATETIPADSSMDYLYALGGSAVVGSSKAFDVTYTTPTTTESVTTTNSGSTSVVTEESTVTDSPGFGLIISLLTIGVIAFAAPRLRREKIR